MFEYDDIGFVWGFFACLPVMWRMHQVGRLLLMPFRRLLVHLPEKKSSGEPVVLLDLGCGHGNFLALTKHVRPDLELIGLDLSPEKIVSARHAFETSHCPVRELAVCDIADFPKQSVDVITILDVLYLVPLENWDHILGKCYECLKPGGRLLLKEMNRKVYWKFAVLCLEETLAVKILHLTKGDKFTFPSPEEIHQRLERAGFSVREEPIHQGYTVPHFLWIGSKQPPASAAATA